MQGIYHGEGSRKRIFSECKDARTGLGHAWSFQLEELRGKCAKLNVIMPGVLTETQKGGHFHLTQFINSLTFKSPWEKREVTFNLCEKKKKTKLLLNVFLVDYN